MTEVKKQSLMVSTLWYSLGNILIRAMNFILLPLYSNLISPSEFGVYSLIISAYTIISVFYQAGLQPALTKFYLDEPDKEKRTRVFSSIINFVMVVSVVLTILLFFFSDSLSFYLFGKGDYSFEFRLILIIMLCESFTFYIIHLFRTEELSLKVIRYLIVSAVINFSANIVLVSVWNWGIRGIIYSQLVSAVVLVLILIPDFIREYKFVLDKEFIKKALIFSLPLLIAGFFSTLVDVVDRFFLNIFVSEREVGLYSFAYKIAMFMNLFVLSFKAAWLPNSLNSYNNENSERYFGRVFLRYIFLASTILIGVTLLTDFAFGIKIMDYNLLEGRYREGMIVLPVLMAGYLFSGVAGYFSYYPYRSGRSKIFLLSDAIAVGVNILLNIVLIPKFGMMGAAFATLISFIASAVYSGIISQKNKKIEIDYPALAIIAVITVLIIYVGKIINNPIISVGLVIIYIPIGVLVIKEKLGNVFRFKEFLDK